MMKERAMKNKFDKLPHAQKQIIASESEVDPKMAFTKNTISALKASQKYKLKGLKLDSKK
jgi:hypothetical protein